MIKVLIFLLKIKYKYIIYGWISYNTSDYRIKNIKTLDETYTIDNIRPISYANISTNAESNGVVAHELQDYFPFLVNGEKDGEKMQSVDYRGLIGILIHEIQQLKKRHRIITPFLI